MCSAKGSTGLNYLSNSNSWLLINEHTHQSDESKINRKFLIEKMKLICGYGMHSPREAINTVMRGADENKVRCLGNRQNILRVLRRHVKNCLNPKPYMFLELELSYLLSVTHLNTTFYQYGPGNYRGFTECDDIVLFFSQEMLANLNFNEIRSVDGTFSMVPPPYFQLFTISYICNHHVFPCVFALLKNKRETTYNTLYTILNNIQIINPPRIIKTDFETASINALRSNFPNAHISGCLFHLSQAIQRKLQDLNLFGR